MTLDEAIADALHIAEGQDKCAEISVSDHAKERMSACAADHRQLAQWLMELKDLRVELNDNGVYIGELEAERKEYRRLLKAAMEDMNTLYESGKDEGCIGIKFRWRYADEALKLIGDD